MNVISMVLQPKSGLGHLILRFLITHILTHMPSRTPLNEWSAYHRGCFINNTQQTQQMNIHALSGIQARDPSNEAATGNKELFFIISISLWQLFQRRRNPALP